MKIKNTKTDKEYFYDYKNIFITTEVAKQLKERASEMKLSKSELLQELLNQTKTYDPFSNGK